MQAGGWAFEAERFVTLAPSPPGSRRRPEDHSALRIPHSVDPLNLVVEIKGFRGEDAKEKANTMRSYWVPGVNNLGKFGRWAFAEFTGVFEIDADFAKLIQSHIAASSVAAA